MALGAVEIVHVPRDSEVSVHSKIHIDLKVRMKMDTKYPEYITGDKENLFSLCTYY
jgi:hypothetical protein